MNDDRAVWRKGDLCTVDGHGDDVFEIIDAGMGMPRAGMELLRLDGKCHVTNVCSAGLRRPQPVRGTWVRRLGTHHRARVIFNSGTVPSPSITCDYEEGVGTFEPVFFSAHPKYWVPVATPKDFRGCDCEPGSKQDFEYQKFLVGELTEKLQKFRGVEHERDQALTKLEASKNEQNFLLHENARLERWLEGVPGLKEEVRKLEVAYKAACEHRDSEQSLRMVTESKVRHQAAEIHALKGEIEKMKAEVFLWKEKSRLNARENQHLFALYEARIQRDKQKKRIVM